MRAVAAFREAPDLVISGARVLNVFSGSIEPREIGVVAGRVAWILAPGEAPRSVLKTPSLDLAGGIAVPGLVEPHAHPELLYGPIALSSAAAGHGTTTLCADMLTFTTVLDDPDLIRLLRSCECGPARMLWALRASAEGGGHLTDKLNAPRLIRLLEQVPSIVTVGEMTAWRDLTDGDNRLSEFVTAARRNGMRINGHLPGASRRSLQRAAVAGISDDHEAMTAEEALMRLDNGFWIMVRHSSLRPDARRIAAGLVAQGRPLGRVMLTTDGPVAADLVNGHLDVVVREVIAAGVDPVDAVRLATLNPATYLRLDEHIGAIAPGRFADITVVSSLADFRVESVLVGGVRPTAAPAYPAGLNGPPLKGADLTAAHLRRAAAAAPAVRLDGVLTRVENAPVPQNAIAALVARNGSWLVAMSVADLELDALASSYGGTGDILLIGQDADLLVDAYDRLVQLGSGIVTPRRTLPLPLLGALSPLPVDELANIVAEFAAEIHLPGGDIPLEFLTLFMGLGVLPELRLTPGGVLEVKTGRIVARPTRLEPR